ncbi:MAG TPA: HAD family phosphatase [Terriglobales bacterium]|jgi:beta-phosphoglucomutase-like phosphatase (HAD superfamily)|nr:HAD family phosphatase [Terriglobales bacterium]
MTHLIDKLDAGIRAVVFDMDGVLIDSHPAHLTAWQEFLRSVGVHAPHSELSFILEGRTRGEILRHFLGELPEPELSQLGRRKDEIFRVLESSIGSFPGVLGFLSELQRMSISCGVATSASEIRTASTIERLGLGGFFDAVITASDVVAGKPHPQVYQLACQRMCVPPSQAMAFDDAPAGVLAARNAGLRCVGVSQNGMTQALLNAGAEQVIPNFVDLRPQTVLSFSPEIACSHPSKCETEPLSDQG